MSFYLAQVLTGLASAATLFLVAAGLSLIFGVTRIVNFAHGSFYMLGAYLALTLVDRLGSTPLAFWSALLLAALIVGLLGTLLEILVLRRIYKAPELFQLLATFGVILVVQDAALWLWGPEDVSGPRAPGLRGPVTVAGARLPAYDLVLIGAAPLVLLLLWLVLRRTRWGILVRAATADREMVGALGVNQAWLFSSVFFLGSFLAGLAGAIQLPKGGASLLMDTSTIAAAFVVVVIGGMGSITGAFLASVIIGELQAFGVLLLPQLSPVIMFLAMAVVLTLRPWGLLGRPDTGPARAAATVELLPRLPPRALGLAWTAVVVVLLLLPLAADDFTLVLAVEVLVFALFAASLHAIMGPGGLASFGHAAYFGGGAYAAALAASRTRVADARRPAPGPRRRRPPGARLRLALRPPARRLLRHADARRGRAALVRGRPVDRRHGRRRRHPRRLAHRLGRRPPGLLLPRPRPGARRRPAAAPCCRLALRLGAPRLPRQPLRAEAVGIGVARQQWLAFGLSGACAGLAGGLYLYAKGSVFPNEASIGRSFDALMMVLLGGVQAASGPLVGASAYTLLETALSRFQLWRLLLGLTIILLVLAFPQGLAGLLGRRAAEA